MRERATEGDFHCFNIKYAKHNKHTASLINTAHTCFNRVLLTVVDLHWKEEQKEIIYRENERERLRDVSKHINSTVFLCLLLICTHDLYYILNVNEFTYYKSDY